jgi:spoIIIJ-associated protein
MNEDERAAQVEEDPSSQPSSGAGGDEAATPADEAEAVEPATPDEVAEVGKEFVSGLLAAMELEAEVATSIEDETAFIDVTGEGLGGLIGRRGQTLDSLQEIVRTAVQRRLRSRVRLLVDVEGYRARRRTSLVEYALEMAERAKERGTEIELEPMSAYERKIVHQAVADIDGASSFSEGEEPSRKVVIRGD